MIEEKEELFRTICNTSKLETLGFFVGAGFSKAVLENNPNYKSYKWGELLEKCCEELEVNDSIMKSHCSYPEMATNICKKYAESKNIEYVEAVKEFKKKVCELTNSYPEENQREKYAEWFEKIAPSWIITTNYDTLIENVIGGSALPISPNGYFCNINGMTPVFHLHGICNEPEEIVITNEDYTYMFRPNDYRHARLPFLMKESCVLMIGYGLGDINVITAVDWANNVYLNTNEGYDFPIIQLLYKENPKQEPYVDKDGIVIYEISSIESFFTELCDYMNEYEKERDEETKKLKKWLKYFDGTQKPNNIDDFIQNKNKVRNKILKFFKALKPEFGYAYNNFFSFLRVSISKLDKSSRRYMAFNAYDDKLCMLLDILVSVPVKKMPPSFFGMLADELNKVGNYVNPSGTHTLGSSYAATDSWKEKKDKIPEDMIVELRRFANSGGNSYGNLKILLNSIEKSRADG